MPRRGRSMGMGRSPSPTAPMQHRPYHAVSRPPPAPVSSVPAHAPAQPSALAAAQPKQPGMFAQMATTAAGVAVGSAIGHTVGAAMTGGMGGGHSQAAPAEQQPTTPTYEQSTQQNPSGPCAYEIRQFLECAQNQHDLTLCDGFNEAIRQCKLGNGISALHMLRAVSNYFHNWRNLTHSNLKSDFVDFRNRGNPIIKIGKGLPED
uniref:CHCH domain-containing protein n=1 Tax=Strigamia maritima TaxID=126957 RepID=T1J8S8_STRMM